MFPWGDPLSIDNSPEKEVSRSQEPSLPSRWEIGPFFHLFVVSPAQKTHGGPGRFLIGLESMGGGSADGPQSDGLASDFDFYLTLPWCESDACGNHERNCSALGDATGVVLEGPA